MDAVFRQKEALMIELNCVSSGYAGHKILRDVTVSFGRGQLTAVIGKNGSGKSTLVKTAVGLIECMQGKVLLEGEVLSKIPVMKRAQKMAYVMQSQNTPDLTVLQTVLHGRFSRKSWPRRYGPLDYQKAREAMEAMNITHLETRFLEELSGGERQKAYLATALCQEADFLFLDEPGTFLDIKSQRELLETSRKLCKQNKGVIIVVHDLLQALENADRLLVMDKGTIVFDGSAEELLKTDILEKIFSVRIKSLQISGQTIYFYSE